MSYRKPPINTFIRTSLLTLPPEDNLNIFYISEKLPSCIGFPAKAWELTIKDWNNIEFNIVYKEICGHTEREIMEEITLLLSKLGEPTWMILPASQSLHVTQIRKRLWDHGHIDLELGFTSGIEQHSFSAIKLTHKPTE
jgi:hypothetical protein